MANNKKDEAIVLKMTNYRESDGMATLLLKEGGIRRFIYRSYYKASSKMLSRGIPLTKLTLQYRDKKEGLLIATQMDIIENYTNIKLDVHLNLYGNILSEILLATFEDLDSSLESFNLAQTYLNYLNKGIYPDYLLAILISSVLAMQGLSPQVDHHVLTHDSIVNHFSIEDGGFITTRYPLLNSKQLKQIRLLFKMNYSHIELIEPFDVDERVLSIIMDYFHYHSGIILKSWEIFKEI